MADSKRPPQSQLLSVEYLIQNKTSKDVKSATKVSKFNGTNATLTFIGFTPTANKNYGCGYWKSDSDGFATDGVTYVKDNKCSTSHFTDFGIFFEDDLKKDNT